MYRRNFGRLSHVKKKNLIKKKVDSNSFVTHNITRIIQVDDDSDVVFHLVRHSAPEDGRACAWTLVSASLISSYSLVSLTDKK